MFTRKENGKLGMSDLDMHEFFGNLYKICKTEKEVNWVRENLISYAEYMADERTDEFDEEE
jgi:hypothetical protein